MRGEGGGREIGIKGGRGGNRGEGERDGRNRDKEGEDGHTEEKAWSSEGRRDARGTGRKEKYWRE